MIETRYVFSLDQSTSKVGYSLWEDDELIKYGSFTPRRNLSADMRIHEITIWLQGVLDILIKDCGGEHNITCLVEDIQFQTTINGSKKYFNNASANNIATFKVLAMLLGAIKTLFIDKHLYYETIAPSSWKSIVGIKSKYRNEQKEETKRLVREELGVDVSEDEADAICIAIFSDHFQGSTPSSSIICFKVFPCISSITI